MWNKIDPIMDGVVENPKNANCEKKIRHVSYILHLHAIGLPETQ